MFKFLSRVSLLNRLINLSKSDNLNSLSLIFSGILIAFFTIFLLLLLRLSHFSKPFSNSLCPLTSKLSKNSPPCVYLFLPHSCKLVSQVLIPLSNPKVLALKKTIMIIKTKTFSHFFIIASSYFYLLNLTCRQNYII